MHWTETVRTVNLILGVINAAIIFRVLKEQRRRGWGETYQYMRFGVLAGFCLVTATTAIDRLQTPLTWRTYAITVLLIASSVSIHGIRKQQRAIPPSGARHPRHGGPGDPGDPAWPQD
jgi:hypothetical protein